MRIYIVEDDINIVRILERIIFEKKLGDLVASSDNGREGLENIVNLSPDIALVDLLMPEVDGISLVRQAKKLVPATHFIMISQVSSKEMIAKAYEAGVEYFISKPIDVIEVQSVINRVKDKINISRKLDQIESLFLDSGSSPSLEKATKDTTANIRRLMQKIGILGEVGSSDIISLAEYLIENNETISNYTIKELCSRFTDNPKTMEQRIRRTATVGMINLANIGIEDYMNEIFTEYSNGIYNFEQVKLEMDHIRGKSKKRGSVNIKKFIEGIVYYSSH